MQAKLKKDILQRKKFLKNEIKIFLLKSILLNRNLSYKTKLLAGCLLMLKQKHKKLTPSKNRNLCIYTSKSKTTFKFSNASRWLSKKFNDFGLIQGIKRN